MTLGFTRAGFPNWAEIDIAKNSKDALEMLRQVCCGERRKSHSMTKRGSSRHRWDLLPTIDRIRYRGLAVIDGEDSVFSRGGPWRQAVDPCYDNVGSHFFQGFEEESVEADETGHS